MCWEYKVVLPNTSERRKRRTGDESVGKKWRRSGFFFFIVNVQDDRGKEKSVQKRLSQDRRRVSE